MLFIWVILFVAAFLGTIALVFYLTLELNEMEKSVGGVFETVREFYGIEPPSDPMKTKKKKD